MKFNMRFRSSASFRELLSVKIFSYRILYLCFSVSLDYSNVTTALPTRPSFGKSGLITSAMNGFLKECFVAKSVPTREPRTQILIYK